MYHMLAKLEINLKYIRTNFRICLSLQSIDFKKKLILYYIILFYIILYYVILYLCAIIMYYT